MMTFIICMQVMKVIIRKAGGSIGLTSSYAIPNHRRANDLILPAAPSEPLYLN